MTTGHISITRRYKQVGNCYHVVIDNNHNVEWDRIPLALIDNESLGYFSSSGNLYEIGPYIAKVIDSILTWDYSVVVRVDHLLATPYVITWYMAKKWQWISRWIIYILISWGVANQPRQGDYYGWYLVKERWS